MKLKDLAKVANVSESTASKALKGSKEIHEDTIKHVIKVARESGYFLEQKKQRIEQSKTFGRVIIVVPEVVSVYYSVLATAITEKLRSQNIESQICYYNFQSELKDLIFLQSLSDVRVAGVIILDTIGDGIKGVSDFPVVSTTDSKLYDTNAYFGMYQAIQHLIELGHKKIYFLGEKLTVHKSKVFLNIINELGLNEKDCKCLVADFRFEREGWVLAEELINKNDLPTAILCAYDEIAFGAISAFIQHGLKVPKDISVIGINDVPSAKFYPVPLTTIAFSTEEFCENVLNLLNAKIKGDMNSKLERIKTCLIVRSSTAKVKNK